jgi:bifunctional DNA-binding transcriptional regulator/antitoxin component of YhaV-PrlF toxin-antitoxin module
MRITSKGQVTIPIAIRRKAGLGQRVVEAIRGKATTRLTTDQIMALTRKG